MKNKGGAPAKMTKETVKILEDAFSNGATDIEACFIAGIHKQTLYNYQKKNPKFIDRKQALKDMIKYQARKSIKESIETEKTPDTAKWYLERKEKKEFSTRSEQVVDDKRDDETLEELKKINETLDGKNKNR